MMRQVIIDSNVLVGLIDERDKWHSQAQQLIAAFLAHGFGPVYLDCAINETVTVLARRAEEQHRSSEFPGLLSDLITRVPASDITWISGNLQYLYDDVIALVSQHLGSLHFNDALIALASKELGIQAIASFDEDFDAINWLTRVARVDHDQLVRIGRTSGRTGKLFALLVHGDSMSEAGIHNGDYVVVEEDNRADAGEIVLARFKARNELMVGYFYPEEQRVRLQFANSALPPLLFPFDQIEIVGRVIDTIHHANQ